MRNFMKKIIEYFNNILASFFAFINVLLGGPIYQSFAARNYDLRKRGKFNITFLIDVMFFVFRGRKNHCMHSWIDWTLKNTINHNLKEKLLEEEEYEEETLGF